MTAFLAAVRDVQFIVRSRSNLRTQNQFTKRNQTSPASEFVTHDAINRTNAEESNVAIQTTQDGRGWGVFAKHDISAGQRVFRGKALRSSSTRCSHSVQTGWLKHALMDLPAILINHSCCANTGIKPNDLGAYDFFALKNLRKEEELLYDYETTEYEIAQPFQCSCGPKCRGKLEGFKKHGNEILQAYGNEYVAPYLLKEPER